VVEEINSETRLSLIRLAAADVLVPYQSDPSQLNPTNKNSVNIQLICRAQKNPRDATTSKDIQLNIVID